MEGDVFTGVAMPVERPCCPSNTTSHRANELPFCAVGGIRPDGPRAWGQLSLPLVPPRAHGGARPQRIRRDVLPRSAVRSPAAPGRSPRRRPLRTFNAKCSFGSSAATALSACVLPRLPPVWKAAVFSSNPGDPAPSPDEVSDRVPLRQRRHAQSAAGASPRPNRAVASNSALHGRLPRKGATHSRCCSSIEHAAGRRAVLLLEPSRRRCLVPSGRAV